MLRSVPQMLKKMKNRRKQNFEGEANNMQLDKEDTRRSNLNSKCVFNILILLFVFIMFNQYDNIKVRFHIAVSLSKCYKSVKIHWKRSSNQRKTNRFPAKCAREAPTKSAVLYQSFFSETGLENYCEIPAKSAVFSANLPLKIPRNLSFFPATYQKPCRIISFQQKHVEQAV